MSLGDALMIGLAGAILLFVVRSGTQAAMFLSLKRTKWYWKAANPSELLLRTIKNESQGA